MSGQYRIVHFTPDPYLGTRIPIAALVEDRGQVRVARAQLLPRADCLGRKAAAAVLQLILEGLEDATTLTALPPTVGPLVVLGDQRQLPEGIEAAKEWVEQNVLPRSEHEDETPHVPVPHRATEGFVIFEKLEVHHYVRHQFRARDRWASSEYGPVAGLDHISHYVEGTQLLLMEPMIASRPNFEEEMHKVVRNFLAYRFAMPHMREPTQLIAYVLAGGSTDRRNSAFRALSGAAHDVVDLDQSSDRRRFKQMIIDAARRDALVS